MDLDNLSIILIIAEALMIGGVIASILIAGKKLLAMLPLMSTGLKVATSIMFAGVLLIVFAVRLSSTFLEIFIERFKKEFKFYFAYSKYVIFENAYCIKQSILGYVETPIKLIKGMVISRGSPHIPLQSEDISSQSYLLISPVILQ